jgi:hypothetical protein
MIEDIVRMAGNAADELPMDEASRMARARELFPVEAYRGTREPTQLAPRSGPEFWSSRPDTANTYVPSDAEGGMVTPGRLNLGRSMDIDMGGRAWHELRFDDVPDPEVRGALGPGSVPMTVAREAQNRGYDSVVFRNIVDGGPADREFATPDTVYAILNPSKRRSRFAKFDPARVSEADWLAGLGVAVPVGGGLLSRVRRERDARA